MTRLITIAVLLVVVPVRAGDVAALFPADTLAYVEVARPAETADALAGLLKHSPLADGVPFAHDRFDAAADAGKTPGILRMARIGLLGSPEVLSELRKVRGAAVALTGFTPKGEPKLAAAVRLGDSALLALAAKAFLTATPDLRRVAVVDGVSVFQYRAFVGPLVGPDGKPFAPGDEANPLRGKKPAPGVGEPSFALVPGLFVAGSGVDEVADVLRRHAGKGTGPALAFDAADGPGLVGFVSPAAAFDKFDATEKAADPAAVAWTRFLINPKAVRRVTARLRVSDNALSLAADLDAAPGVPCPLFDLLAGGTASTSIVAPDDAAWAITVTLPTDRKAVLAVADAAAKVAGVVGRLPSEAAPPELGELLAGASAVTVFAPVRQSLPAGAVAMPTVAISAATPAAADRWLRAVPGFVKLVAGLETAPVPSSEVVRGLKVWTVPGAGTPWNSATHYAANGSTFVMGLDREVVAATAARSATAGPVAGTTGVFRPAGLSPPAVPPKPTTPSGPEPRMLPGFAPYAGGSSIPSETLAAGLGHAARHLPPVTFTVTRAGGSVRLTADQRDLAKPVGAAVRDLLLWLEARPVAAGDPHEPPVVEAVPGLR